MTPFRKCSYTLRNDGISGKVTFHITHWPGVTVRVPPLVQNEKARYEEPGVIVFQPTDPSVVPVPEELYLRTFLELDLSDADAALAFCATYGHVGALGFGDLPSAVAILAREDPGLELKEPWRTIAPRDRPGGSAEEVLRLAAIRDELGISSVTRIQSLAELALHQSVLHDLVALHRHVSGQIAEDELLAELRTAYWQWSREDMRFLETGREAMLAEGLNAALTPYQVHLSVGPTVGATVAGGLHNIYQAMCLQLANHIAEKLPYLRCAAEGCSKLFVRTEGYARYGQNRRRGNRYCSHQCANRQAQRDYRRRKAAAKRSGKERP